MGNSSSSSSASGADGRLKVDERISLAIDPDTVWAVVAPFDAIAHWHPAAERSPADRGNEPGSVRQVALVGGDARLVETLISHSDAQRTYTYTLADNSPVPVSDYRSTLTVKPAGRGTEIVWQGDFRRRDTGPDPAPGADDAAAVEAVRGIYRSGLDGIAGKVGG